MRYAAILTLQFKETVYFKYGCSDARFNKFGAMPWLLWSAIVDSKVRSEQVEFDMGRTQEDNAGLLAFKNHWVPSTEAIGVLEIPCRFFPLGADHWKLRWRNAYFHTCQIVYLH